MPAHVAVCFLIEPLVLYMSQTSSAVVSSHLPTPSLPLLLITGSIVTLQTPGSMASEASVTDETVTEVSGEEMTYLHTSLLFLALCKYSFHN